MRYIISILFTILSFTVFGQYSTPSSGSPMQITIYKGGSVDDSLTVTAVLDTLRASLYAPTQIRKKGRITTTTGGDFYQNNGTIWRKVLTQADSDYIQSLVPAPVGGLTSLGGANTVVGMNNAATAYEYKTISIGTSGSSPNVAHTTNTITINIPVAANGATGTVNTSAQTFAGKKTFNGGVNFPNDVTAGFGAGDPLKISNSSATGFADFNLAGGGYVFRWLLNNTVFMRYRTYAGDGLHHFIDLTGGGTILFDTTLSLLSPVVNNLMECNGQHLYITLRGQRYQLDQQTVGSESITNTISTSSAGTLSLTATKGTLYYVFNGSTATYTLPAISGNSGGRYYIMNIGSGNITLNSNTGGADIYASGSSTSTVTISAGATAQFVNNGTYFIKMQ